MFHSYVLQHRAVAPVSSAELCSCSRGDPSRSLLPGAVCLKVSPATQKCSKNLWLCFSGDGDGFTLTSPLHSALTLWFAGRAAQKSLQKYFFFFSAPSFAVHYAGGALTAGNSTPLQVPHCISITICLMALKAAERSGLTAVSPGFKFSCKTCKYLLLTSSLLF